MATRDTVTRSQAPSRRAHTLTVGLLSLTAVYFVAPIVWLIIASSKDNAGLLNSPGFSFSTIQWSKNWESLMAWSANLYPLWVWNSIVYSTVSAAIGTLVAVACGYAIAKFDFPGRNLLQGFLLTGLLMPVAILTVPLYVLFQQFGLTNSVWSIIIPSAVSPFGVLLGRVYAEASVPTELIEAARIDGAREARIFFTIVLRLLAPPMVTIFLFVFVATWNNFLLPLMMISSSSLKPVTLGLYGMTSYFSPDKGAVLLGALLGVIPLIVLFVALQRFWQSGLAAGAVKG